MNPLPARTLDRNRHRRRRGFTLMEMIVVVTIIALLAGLVVPRLWQHVGSAKETVAASEAANLEKQIYAYMLDTGMDKPSDDFDLTLLLLPPDQDGGPNGPYLNKEEDLLDPWEVPYVLRIPGEVNYDFDVLSGGPDLEIGTEDDITN